MNTPVRFDVTHRSPRLPRLPLVLAMLALGFGGCAQSTYQAKVVSVAKPVAEKPLSYDISIRNRPASNPDARFLKAEQSVKAVLASQGMHEAAAGERADMTVELTYGLRKTGVHYESRLTTIVPYSDTADMGTTYNGIISSNRWNSNAPNTTVGWSYNTNSYSYQVSPSLYATFTPPYTYVSGNTTYVNPGSVTYSFARDFTYTYARPVTVIDYEKYLILTARDNKRAVAGQAPKLLWGVRVSCEDPSRDLRSYMPMLAAASGDYVGKSTDGVKNVTIRAADSGSAF